MWKLFFDNNHFFAFLAVNSFAYPKYFYAYSFFPLSFRHSPYLDKARVSFGLASVTFLRLYSASSQFLASYNIYPIPYQAYTSPEFNLVAYLKFLSASSFLFNWTKVFPKFV